MLGNSPFDVTRVKPLSGKGSPVTIYEVAGGLGGGIGFGAMHADNRALGESLERFWLKRGPSSEFQVYSLRHTESQRSVLYAPVRPNFVDSSGCALHPKLSVAFQKAALEFIERQSLVAHWRYGTPFRLVPTSFELPGELSDANVELREISIFSKIYVFLALYSSDRGIVRYAAGAGSQLAPRAAAQGALNECAQAHLLMADNVLRQSQGRPLMDSIQEVFTRANRASTIASWPRDSCIGVLEVASSEGDGIYDEENASETLISALSDCKSAPYVGIDTVHIDGSLFYAVRVFSDDWFMGLHDPLDRRDVIPDEYPIARDWTEPAPFG